MKFNRLIVDIEDKIATLTFNNPEAMNAMSAESWQELGSFFDVMENNEEVQVIILTGAGNKAFVAGADLNSLKTKTGVDVLGAGAQKNLKKIEDSSKVVIAAVNGYAFGGGCEIALACDMRVISDNAIFGLPEAGLGILPGAGGTQRLSKLIGIGRAKEVILAGKTINSKEAVDYGLANRSVDQESLMKEARVLAVGVMKKAPLALRLCKRLINVSVSTDQEAGMLLELFGLSILMNSQDKIEGIDSFLNKRKPEFKGK